MATINFTSRISTTAADGVLLEATVVKDEALGKLQSEINSTLNTNLTSVSTKVSTLEATVAALSGDLNNISGIYTPKGSVNSYDDLPSTGNAVGDVYNVKTSTTVEITDAGGTRKEEYPAGTNFVWVEISPAETFTAGEAITVNSNLDGAVSTETVKTPATYYTYEEYVALPGNEGISEDDFNAKDQAEILKSEAVNYTAEEAIAFNAALTGAVKAGDTKPGSTAEYDWDAIGGDMSGIIEELKSYTDGQLAALEAADGKIGLLESSVQGLGERIDALESGSTDLTGRVVSLESAVGAEAKDAVPATIAAGVTLYKKNEDDGTYTALTDASEIENEATYYKVDENGVAPGGDHYIETEAVENTDYTDPVDGTPASGFYQKIEQAIQEAKDYSDNGLEWLDEE